MHPGGVRTKQVETATVAGLATKRLSAADADRLGRFFELLRADQDSTRFFHPHPLTKAFAASLCARPSAGLDRYYITQYQGRIAAYSMLRGWDEGYDTPSFGGCTHPGLRGAGLGQLLLAHAIGCERVWLFADVAESEMSELAVGAQVAARVLAYPGRAFRGMVEWISATLDPAELPRGHRRDGSLQN